MRVEGQMGQTGLMFVIGGIAGLLLGQMSIDFSNLYFSVARWASLEWKILCSDFWNQF